MQTKSRKKLKYKNISMRVGKESEEQILYACDNFSKNKKNASGINSVKEYLEE